MVMDAAQVSVWAGMVADTPGPSAGPRRLDHAASQHEPVSTDAAGPWWLDRAACVLERLAVDVGVYGARVGRHAEFGLRSLHPSTMADEFRHGLKSSDRAAHAIPTFESSWVAASTPKQILGSTSVSMRGSLRLSGVATHENMREAGSSSRCWFIEPHQSDSCKCRAPSLVCKAKVPLHAPLTRPEAQRLWLHTQRVSGLCRLFSTLFHGRRWSRRRFFQQPSTVFLPSRSLAASDTPVGSFHQRSCWNSSLFLF